MKRIPLHNQNILHRIQYTKHIFLPETFYRKKCLLTIWVICVKLLDVTTIGLLPLVDRLYCYNVVHFVDSVSFKCYCCVCCFMYLYITFVTGNLLYMKIKIFVSVSGYRRINQFDAWIQLLVSWFYENNIFVYVSGWPWINQLATWIQTLDVDVLFVYNGVCSFCFFKVFGMIDPHCFNFLFITRTNTFALNLRS